MSRKLSLAVIGVLIILAAPVLAGSLDARIAAVGKTIDETDDMFRAAMKGHLPSLEEINSLRARFTLARELFKDAKDEAEGGDPDRAGAGLDAAEFLAQRVYEAAKH